MHTKSNLEINRKQTLSQLFFLNSFFCTLCIHINFVGLKQNENETTIHLKVTHAIQQKVSSNIKKLT